MDAQELFNVLRKAQEPKGYFFSRDMDKTLDLLDALLVNRKRYGYMGCPCRLNKGDNEADRDIICPCDYRAADVNEYGSCYCGLYVAKEVNDGMTAPQYVPERRPAEKC